MVGAQGQESAWSSSSSLRGFQRGVSLPKRSVYVERPGLLQWDWEEHSGNRAGSRFPSGRKRRRAKQVAPEEHRNSSMQPPHLGPKENLPQHPWAIPTRIRSFFRTLHVAAIAIGGPSVTNWYYPSSRWNRTELENLVFYREEHSKRNLPGWDTSLGNPAVFMKDFMGQEESWREGLLELSRSAQFLSSSASSHSNSFANAIPLPAPATSLDLQTRREKGDFDLIALKKHFLRLDDAIFVTERTEIRPVGHENPDWSQLTERYAAEFDKEFVKFTWTDPAQHFRKLSDEFSFHTFRFTQQFLDPHPVAGRLINPRGKMRSSTVKEKELLDLGPNTPIFVAPRFLRYHKELVDLECLFGSLENFRIAEIGGGFGGLAAAVIARYQGRIERYCTLYCSSSSC